MNSIISILVAYNQLLLAQINQLLLFITKNIYLKSKTHGIESPKYNKFTVDKLPVIKTFDKLDYKQLLQGYMSKHGKDLKPVKSRGGTSVPADTVCPRCGAPPNLYIR